MSKITSQSLYELKNVSQPLAVDEAVFYLETRIDKESNSYKTSLWRLDLKNQDRTLWLSEDYNPTAIEVSPNQKYLSFLSSFKGDKAQLYLIPLTGGAAFALTNEKQGVTSYLWTANSASLYYQTSHKEEEDQKVGSTWPQPTKINRLQHKADGVGLLPEDLTYQVKQVAVASQEVSTVLEKDQAFNLQYVAQDESYLLYVDRLDPDDEWVYGASVYEYNLAQKTARLVTGDYPKGSFYFEAVNRDETAFLLSGNDFSHAFVSLENLYLWDRESQEVTRVSVEDKMVGDTIVGDFQQKLTGFPVKWVSDHVFIYPVTDHGKTVLYQGKAQGQNEKVLDKKIHLTGGDLVKENQLVVTYSTLNQASRLALVDLTSQTITDLYNPNQAFEQDHRFADIESFYYQGADKDQVQGWYVKPLDQSENHPAVVYIHGGPQVNYGETFFHEVQYLAGAGYGVIMLNPHGGNSYGQEFVATILGDYGNKDYEDIMLGTDYVLENHPEVDPDNLFVAGGSYGGFMTNWIVGHTDRFKAAVTQRSISNWISFYGSSDVGAFFVEFQLQADLSRAEDLWRMSPIAYANQSKTPLLVLHGQEDLRCPQEQGEQMYIAMKKAGVDTKLVLYPDSSHGLSRQGLPNLRIERLEEIKSWFDHYAGL